MAIAKLSIDLEARLAGLQQGLDRAAVLAARQAERISAAFSGVRAAAAGLGAAFTVGAFATWIRSTADGIDKLNDLADATGATVENLSALEDVAARTGTSIDTAGDAVVKMNKALADAKPGSDQAKAFEAIGVSVAELKQLDPVEAFQRIAVALQGFADDGNKARIVQELFGKSLREVAPLLRDVAEAGKLVATVTKEQTAEAEKFNKELFAMQKTVLDLSRALIGPFVSSLNKAIAGIREARGAWETLKAIDASAGILMGGVAPNAGGATGSWEDAAPKPSLPAALPSAAKSRGGAGSAKAAAEERRRLAEFSARQIVEIEEQAAQDTADAWKAWERQQLDLAKQRADAEQEQWRQVFEFIDQQQAEAIEQGQAVLEVTKKTVDEWSVFADEAARNIQDALGDTLLATMEGNFASIGAGWKRMLDRMVAEALAAKIGQALLGDFGKTGDIGGLAGDLFKWAGTFFGGGRADGGPVQAGMTYLVGERGPELLHMGKGSGGGSITPNSRAAAQSITIHQHITAPAGADRASRLQLMADIGLATQRAIARNT